MDGTDLSAHEDVNLGLLLSPNLDANEEHRILYVALSRAKNHLAISVSALSEEIKEKLQSLSIKLQVLK